MSQKILMVTAALLKHTNKILIAQRLNTGRFANKWEFPGGKIDPGETPQECLSREIREELGLEINAGSLFSDTLHPYEHGQIRQFTFWVELPGIPDNIQLNEHQAIAWVTPQEMSQYDFAAADFAVVEKLQRQNNSI